jgi:hypothetical protein
MITIGHEGLGHIQWGHEGLGHINWGHEGLESLSGPFEKDFMYIYIYIYIVYKKIIEKHGFRRFWPFYEGYELRDPSRTSQGENYL